ncbi:unnamed protein product [Caenorhabditis brenneri]
MVDNYNLMYCFLLNGITWLVNFLIWQLFGGVEHIPNPPIFMIVLFSVFFSCILLRFILNLYYFSNGTTLLSQYIQDYKISLGCLTFGSLFPFLVISMFEIDSATSTLCFLVCPMLPVILLSVLIGPSLEHCDLDSTRLNIVAEMKTSSVASVLFTLMLLCFGVPNMGSNKLVYLLQQVSWILANLPYYIEFYWVMTEPLDVRLVRNGTLVARNNHQNEPNEPNPNALNVRLVRNENEVAMDNNRGTIRDDSDSSDESDGEQLPNSPTNILISSEDLQCNVCFLQYSEKRVPLVLTKCGHSLCKKCCKAAQQQLPLSGFINCPFCRTQTPGPVAMLPKNYAIMGIVQKIGRVN